MDTTREKRRLLAETIAGSVGDAFYSLGWTVETDQGEPVDYLGKNAEFFRDALAPTIHIVLDVMAETEATPA